MHRFVHASTAVIASLAFFTLPLGAQGLSNGRWGQVWGAWVHQVQLGTGMKMPALITLNIDGGVTGAPGLMFGGIPSATVRLTPVFGIWQRTSSKSAAVTSLFLVFDAASGVLTAYGRSRASLIFSNDFNRYTGTEFMEYLACPSPVTCPNPVDTEVAWVADTSMPATGFPVSGNRLELVRSGPLKP